LQRHCDLDGQQVGERDHRWVLECGGIVEVKFENRHRQLLAHNRLPQPDAGSSGWLIRHDGFAGSERPRDTA